MDDLQRLAALLAEPGPSRDVVDRGRGQLNNMIHGQARRPGLGGPRRLGWLAGGFGLAAAAAVVVVVATVAVGPSVPSTIRGRAPATAGAPVITHLSGRQILLDFATTAAARPAGSGTYWHVEAVFDDAAGRFTQETWTRRDGAFWVLDPSGAGVLQMGGAGGFQVGASTLTFSQLQRLPTSPAGLEAWIADSFRHPVPVGRVPVPPGTVPDLPGAIAVSLSSLLYQVPAPPAVRAAAFRALAAQANVKSLGAVAGGQGLLIFVQPPPGDKLPSGRAPAGLGQIELVIDPATAQVHSFTNYQGTETIVTEGWTNVLPKVIQPPPKRTEPGKAHVKW